MASTGCSVRNASHAGSWFAFYFCCDCPSCDFPKWNRYTDDPRELHRELTEWLGAAGSRHAQSARAIISPHAGYSYSGRVAAFAFKQIIPETVSIIFVLGPSHVMSLDTCALSTCSRYRTPIGDLQIDERTNVELKETGAFSLMDLRSEEAEHSIEMQLPYIAKIMEKQSTNSYSIVPVLVGSLSPSKQATYGKIFSKYLSDPKIVFVVSSDFCHWGSRFHFMPHDSSTGLPIYEQIAAMDKQGMDAISSLNPATFGEYLKRTQNTICGRNPISVILYAAEYFRQMNSHLAEFVFLKYAQSNQSRSLHDSSVSYAAGALFINPQK
uniref:Protein MEMO1 n=1 Tax=Setaria digitata TaxID=48799 RepID=A0A915PVR6_9BILA